MTTKTFNKVWSGVLAPYCRGAKYPAFDPAAINCSLIADELRPKEYDFSLKNDVLEIEWISQEWCRPDSLVKEIRRCMLHIGFVGEVRMKIHQRGESLYGYCGARRRFVIRTKARLGERIDAIAVSP